MSVNAVFTLASSAWSPPLALLDCVPLLPRYLPLWGPLILPFHRRGAPKHYQLHPLPTPIKHTQHLVLSGYSWTAGGHVTQSIHIHSSSSRDTVAPLCLITSKHIWMHPKRSWNTAYQWKWRTISPTHARRSWLCCTEHTPSFDSLLKCV